jgi:hypothetical protein
MSAVGVEVADVLRGYSRQYLSCYPGSPAHRRILDQLSGCRTAAMGGHLRRCRQCAHELIAYNSCRNRHCPKCQRQKQADWLDKQSENLLNVPYFHVVFTLPQSLSRLALQNKRLLYGMLFHSASQALLRTAADPKHLGARVGFTTILHTWGQTLMHHPHVHCLVPAGGLSPCGQNWIHARTGFLVPVRVLSRLFRGCFLAGLCSARKRGELRLTGRLACLNDPVHWGTFVGKLRQSDWVVYAKPAFGSPDQVLKYLARYTHRVAISNRRLVSIKGGILAFRYKDYRRGHQQRLMHLPAVEFIRRFLLHSLPKGFMRIRHYGFLANRTRQKTLAICRSLLAKTTRVQPQPDPSPPTPDRQTHYPCPKCNHPTTLVIAMVPPVRAGPEHQHKTHPWSV